MEITKVQHHGQTRFRVNDPHGPDGKRQRKFFDTREAAEHYVKERTADTKAFGVHVSTIPPEERAAIAYQLQRLKTLGWSLAAAGLRPRYVKTLRASIHRFLLNRREKLIADITAAEIHEYIRSAA